MKVLVFAPHNDDEVLGVGGTIAKHVSNGDVVYVLVATVGNNDERASIIRSEALAADRILGVKERFFIDVPVVEMDITSKKTVNHRFLEIVDKIKPEVAYIPHVGDIHEDHKQTAKAAMVALRPYEAPWLRKIYSYETLSESEWENPMFNTQFVPTAWNDISFFIQQKKQAMACYKTQIREYPHPRSIDAIEVLAKHRGTTVGFEYAEAFATIREMW